MEAGSVPKRHVKSSSMTASSCQFHIVYRGFMRLLNLFFV